MKLVFSQQILEKCGNFNFNEKSFEWEPSCSMRKGRKDMMTCAILYLSFKIYITATIFSLFDSAAWGGLEQHLPTPPPTPSEAPAHKTYFSLNLEVQACLSPLSWGSEILETLEALSGSSVVGSRFGVDKVLEAGECACRPVYWSNCQRHVPVSLHSSEQGYRPLSEYVGKKWEVAKLITKLPEIRRN